MVGTKSLKRIVLVGVAVAVLAFTACPSPFLERIKEEIAKYPFAATSYSWLRQWGNAYRPEWTFVSPIVKADTAGYVYVADSTFQIRKFNSSGVLQKTYALQTSLGLGGVVYDMAFDAAGNMYAVTNSTNQIQKYTNAGDFVTDWGGSTVYGTATLGSPRAIAVDPSGNVYVTDSSAANKRVVKFTSSGTFQAEWGGATLWGTLAFGSTLYGIAVDKNSYVYVSDANNNRVVKFNSSGTYQTEWGGATLYPASGTTLSSPRGITLSTGTTQYVYLADRSNYRVVKTDIYGTNTTAVIVGLGAGTSDGYFNYPNTVAVDTSGSIYVGDDTGTFDRVQKFSPTPAWAATWGGAPSSADGVVANTGGVVLDSSDASYVVDVYNQRIEKFDSTGNYAGVKWGSPGSASSQFSFNGPPTIDMDSAGKIYVADPGNRRIQVFDSAGAYLNQWGTGGAGNGQFGSYSPTGVVVDSSGNIYAADAGNHRIQVFDSDGYYLRQWGSSGSGDGQFLSIYGIAIDGSNNVYVSDMGTHRIQKFDSQGNLLLKWGSQGSADGQFQSPVGVAVDRYDHVFVADMGNRRVQKFDSSGNLLCKWGSIGSGSGSFAWVVGIAVNSQGHVLTTDWYGNLVQEFQPAQ